MQIDHFGKQQRHQHVAVQTLNDQVNPQQPHELGTPAPLEKRHQRHRHRHHHCTNIGHDHRQPYHQGEQHGELQAHQGEGYEGRGPDHQHFQKLTAHIIAHLPVHLAPDLLRQGMIVRQEAVQPLQDQVLILQKEEYQQWHQHHVDGDGDDAHSRRQRPGQHALTPGGDLGLYGVDDAQHLYFGNELRVHRRQAKQ